MNVAQIKDINTRLRTNGLTDEAAAKLTLEMAFAGAPDGFFKAEHAAALIGLSPGAICKHCTWKRLTATMQPINGVSTPHFKLVDLDKFVHDNPNFKSL